MGRATRRGIISWSVTSGIGQVSEPERGRNRIWGCCAEQQGLGGWIKGSKPRRGPCASAQRALPQSTFCAIAPEGLIRDVFVQFFFRSVPRMRKIPHTNIFPFPNMLAR